MTDAKPKRDTSWKIPLSELFILLGFVLLVSVGIATVVVPEMQDEPEAKPSGSTAVVDKEPNQANKPSP